jgi:hypothetical protein
MRKYILAILLSLVSSVFAAEVNFSCYVEGVARCFPSDKSMLDIAVDLMAYGDTTGNRYVIYTDRKNRMVFIMFDNTMSDTIRNLYRQGIAMDARPAVLEKAMKDAQK